MKKRFLMKVQAIALAACVTLSTFDITAIATQTTPSTTQVTDITETDSTDTTENTETTDSTSTTENTETTDSTSTTENTETTDSTSTTENTETTDSTSTTENTETTDSTSTTENTETTDNTEASDSTTTDSTNATDSTVAATDTTTESSNTTLTDSQDTSTQTITEDSTKTDTKTKESEEIVERHMGYNSVDDLTIPTLYDGTYVPNQQGSLPSKYDSRDYGYITPVRDQGTWGTCWSFAALGMAEANIVKKGLAGSTLNLSELQLAYFFYHTVTDPLGNTAGDSTQPLTDSYLDQGGNSAFTTFALASWIGASDESKAPYEAATYDSYALDDSLAFNDDYHLQNAYWINMLDTSEVKNMIMNYGAVATSYYSDQLYNYTTTYYNGSTYAYYYDNQYNSNHAITIVGWDDSFNASNFNEEHRPSSNGAWLVKNSWGSDFGDSGYFWISYQDSAFTSEGYSQAYVFDMESANNYDHNYQYDGSCGIRSYGIYNGGSISNVFTAKANSDGAEQIKAVSFALYDINVDYQIQIYTNLTNSQDPTSGTAMLSSPKTGRTSYVGYYTVPLDEAVSIGEGSTFSVVITLSRQASNGVYFFFDYSYANAGWINFTNACEAGQSFVKWNSGSSWDDLGLENATARIKAFTTDIDQIYPTGISLNNTSITLKAGDSAALTASITPSATTETSVTWSSSNEAVATVDANGTVTGTGIGTATITAETSNGLTAACTVTGKIGKVNGLKAASQSTTSVKLSWTKQNGVGGYEIYRYNTETKKYEKIGTNSKASKTTYNNKSLTVATTYKYKVRAYVKINGKKKYGSYSAVFQTSTKTEKPTLSVSALSKKAKLTWEKVSGASGYEIYMSTKKSSGYSLIKTIKKGKTVSYTKSKLTKNKRYYFKIRTYKTVSGNKVYSGYSKVITVKIK